MMTEQDYMKAIKNWDNVSPGHVAGILNLTGCKQTYIGPSRNPFQYVTQHAALETKDKNWLTVQYTTWKIGDNVEFPSQNIRIRDVNKLMTEFIFQHFESPGATTVPSKTDPSTALPFSRTYEPDRVKKLKGEHKGRTIEGWRPIHIGGTPGTGKSAFALYLLYKIIEKYPSNTVVYRHGDVNPGCFIYYEGQSYYHPSITLAFSDDLLCKLLTRDSTEKIWTVLDGAASIPTGTTIANMVVLTSPGQQSVPLKHLVKSAITLINPPWSLDDILLVREDAYAHLSTNSVRRLYEMWGGVPRILLDHQTAPEKGQELLDSVYTADPISLFRQAGLSRIDHANVSGTHFHLVPGEKLPADIDVGDEAEFRYPAYCWASTWLQNRFWEELKNQGGEITIMKFLLDWSNAPAARALAFEPHVFRTIENTGLTGHVRRLSGNPTSIGRMKIEATQRKTFSYFGEISNEPGSHDGVFYVPRQTNHASLDLYIPDHGLLLQVTVGQKHGIKRKGLEEALSSGIFDEWKEANPNEKLRLVFLCDSSNHDEFKLQPYLGLDGRTLKDLAALTSINDQVEQYSWELDVSEQLEKHLTMSNKKRGTKLRLPIGSWKVGELNSDEELAGEEAEGQEDFPMTGTSTAGGKSKRGKRKRT